jgi:hypothetical protein
VVDYTTGATNMEYIAWMIRDRQLSSEIIYLTEIELFDIFPELQFEEDSQ